MSRRNQIVILAVLLLALGGMVYRNWRAAPDTVVFSSANEKYQPLPVENPSLRLDLLERIRKLEYTGTKRNIFSAVAPLAPAPKVEPGKGGPPQPQVPEPLVLPVKFYGYMADTRGGNRRAFFTNGEDVFIVGEGEMLLNRFRVLRIGNKTAEVEEIASGRRAMLVLEETGPGAGPQA